MFKTQFYHGLIKKYVSLVGSTFSNIYISRWDSSGTVLQKIEVPIDFSPKEKYVIRLESDPDLKKPVSIQYPAISYELVGVQYAADRKLNTMGRITSGTTSNTGIATVYNPVPYDLFFRVYIIARTETDANQIVEQIFPFFTPDFTYTIKNIVDGIERDFDVPLTLTSIQNVEEFESDFVQKRSITWTLDLTLQGLFFGPVSKPKVIKFANVSIYDNTVVSNTYNALSRVTVQPGLTANGEPTTDINETIPYLEINKEDNWDYIVIDVDV